MQEIWMITSRLQKGTSEGWDRGTRTCPHQRVLVPTCLGLQYVCMITWQDIVDAFQKKKRGESRYFLKVDSQQWAQQLSASDPPTCLCLHALCCQGFALTFLSSCLFLMPPLQLKMARKLTSFLFTYCLVSLSSNNLQATHLPFSLMNSQHTAWCLTFLKASITCC